MDERERDKITMAVMLAIGGGKHLTMSDERRLAAGRVYGQVILPLLSKAWDEAYSNGRDDEAMKTDGDAENPYR
jgi:hypothetical protein